MPSVSDGVGIRHSSVRSITSSGQFGCSWHLSMVARIKFASIMLILVAILSVHSQNIRSSSICSQLIGMDIHLDTYSNIRRSGTHVVEHIWVWKTRCPKSFDICSTIRLQPCEILFWSGTFYEQEYLGNSGTSGKSDVTDDS